MKIAVAQINPLKGNVMANIEKHIQFIELAVLHKVDAVFFPELSITGYEPELAKELVVYVYDKRFDEFQNISNAYGISIGIGVPIQFSTGIQISMIIFIPNKIRKVYSKQLLHPDELPYFVSGDQQIVLTVENKKIVPAICYESLQVENAQQAHALGAEIYVASVAKPQLGIDKAEKHYPFIAKKYGMAVLMANCVGTCDNFLSVGKSSVWNKDGLLLGQLNDTEEGILVFDSETGQVISKTI
ncbi:MAG: carbon-nitrogen hydrolase family protein [Cytophagaceae bacterium]|nr:carbon-nitrogen hydrolase family protein [Cytophagaceae bacterium]